METQGPLPKSDAEFEAKLKEIESTPLFMRSLPDEENPTVEALKSLFHEGTPDEVAQNFKDQGNDYYKGKRCREAMGFYTQGVDAKPTNTALLEALLLNRAACNLELQNYGSVLRDCAQVLSTNPKASKALYRSTLALLALDRTDEAVDAAARCLAFDEKNQPMRVVYERAQEAQKKKEKKKRDRQAMEESRKQMAKELRDALQRRGVFIIPPSGAVQADKKYFPFFDPEDTAAGKQNLVFPTAFLFPPYGISDIVEGFHEETTVGQIVEMLIPSDQDELPWDKDKLYAQERLVVYAPTRKGKLLKLGKKTCLRECLEAAKGKLGDEDGLDLLDGLLQFVVLPRGSVEQKWIDELKSKRQNGDASA